jgi:hypothetical protein
MTDGNGWDEWGKLVLSEIERLAKESGAAMDLARKNDTAIRMLQQRVLIWGSVAVFVATAVVNLGVRLLTR